MLVFEEEGKTAGLRKKTLGARKRTNNKLNPHMMHHVMLLKSLLILPCFFFSFFFLFEAKNVAADISEKLCDSVATKLEGKVLGTFSGKATVIKCISRS